MSKCDLCNPKSSKTIEYLDSLDVLLNQAIGNDDKLSALNQLKIIDDEIVRFNSMYATHQPDLTVEKEIYGRLLITKTKLLIQSVIEDLLIDNKIQLVILGSGDSNIEGYFEELRLDPQVQVLV